MTEEHREAVAGEETDFSRQVGAQAARNSKRDEEPQKASGSDWACQGWSVGRSWFRLWSARPWGFGWTVRYPSKYSWTLMLLLVGLVRRLFQCLAVGQIGIQGDAEGYK